MFFKKLAGTLLLGSVVFSAYGESTFLQLAHLNGSVEEFEITDNFNIKIETGAFVISNDETTLSVPLSELKEYKFLTKSSGVESINPNSNNDSSSKIQFDGKTLHIITGKDSASLKVMNLEGLILVSETIVPQSTTNFDLEYLEPGIYIIMLNDAAHKIVKDRL